MFGVMRVGFSGQGYQLTDFARITAQATTAFSYIAMPGGPRTMLDYMQSFGVAPTDPNTGTGSWVTSFSGDIPYLDNPIADNNFFTEYNRVRLIEGDGTAQADDWTTFNFGKPNGGGSWGGTTVPINKNYGGRAPRPGNDGGLGLTFGYLWGFSDTRGWVLLYRVRVGITSSIYTNLNGYWLELGGVDSTGTPGSYAVTGNGKRYDYDYMPLEYIGFGVK